MATLRYTLNGVTLHALLPVDDSVTIEGDVEEMAGGNLRSWPSARRRTITLRHDNLSEAERTTWESAVASLGPVNLVNERAETISVRIVSYRFPLKRTKPDVEGATAGTGPAWYEAEIVVESLAGGA